MEKQRVLRILNREERAKVTSLTAEYKNNKTYLQESIIQKELERITIEFSWKSSSIEGNTYSLLDTEALLKNNIGAK